jgi:hypothetical protein
LDQIESDSFEDIDATKGPYGTRLQIPSIPGAKPRWKMMSMECLNVMQSPRKAEIKNELKKNPEKNSPGNENWR